MWVNRKQYETERDVLELLFRICPMIKLVYNEIKILYERNYPYKNIVKILKKRYTI